MTKQVSTIEEAVLHQLYYKNHPGAGYWYEFYKPHQIWAFKIICILVLHANKVGLHTEVLVGSLDMKTIVTEDGIQLNKPK